MQPHPLSLHSKGRKCLTQSRYGGRKGKKESKSEGRNGKWVCLLERNIGNE